jgi:hypothetical protein
MSRWHHSGPWNNHHCERHPNTVKSPGDRPLSAREGGGRPPEERRTGASSDRVDARSRWNRRFIEHGECLYWAKLGTITGNHGEFGCTPWSEVLRVAMSSGRFRSDPGSIYVYSFMNLTNRGLHMTAFFKIKYLILSFEASRRKSRVPGFCRDQADDSFFHGYSDHQFQRRTIAGESESPSIFNGASKIRAIS